MRVAVFGATGMLGHEVCRTLAARHEVHGVCRDLQGIAASKQSCFAACKMHMGFEALDETLIESFQEQIEPDVTINCIGAVKQLASGRDAVHAIRINSLFPHMLARACDKRGSQLIQISTDCVFSGQRGHYAEDDSPDATDVYGRSKLLGEVLSPPHLTLRTSIIGQQLRGQTSLLEWFQAQRGGTVKGFGKAIYSGLTTPALAEALGQILFLSPQLAGLFHVSSTAVSKFELLSMINEHQELQITIERDDATVCDRSLDGRKFQAATGIQIPCQATLIASL